VITPGWDGAAADGRSVDRDLVLSVANAHPGKGVPEAIAAFTLAGVGGSRLVLVGDLQRDRAEERRAREALRRCSLPVARAGVVAPARLSELYARAAVLLTASRYEGWPIAVAEAMASGVPIVGFDIAGVRELLRDGHDGLLVPCAEVAALGRAMARVMGDAALAYRMGRAARHRARAWPTWEVTRRRFADELEQLAATRPVPRTRRTRNPTRTP